MFTVIELNNSIALSPNKIGSNIYKKICETLKEKYTNKILGSKDIYIIGILKVDEDSIKDGVIDDIMATVIYDVKYSVIAFKPIKNELIQVKIQYCNDLGIWGHINDLNNEAITCFCPKTFMKKCKYIESSDGSGCGEFDQDSRDDSRAGTKIGKNSVVSLKIVNFKINTNKIEILGSLDM